MPETISNVEFGVCCDLQEEDHFYQVPVDNSVKPALKEMLATTLEQLRVDEGGLAVFEPAQRYGATERLYVPLSEVGAEKIRQLYNAQNLDVNSRALDDLGSLVYYFASFRYRDGSVVLGVRRATQFKGVVKKHLIRLVDDTLQLVEDDIFKLDNDFDFIVKGDTIYILRPSGFEFTAALDDAFQAQALRITQDVATRLSCVEFDDRYMTRYITAHKKAVRLMASLRMRNDLHLTPLKKLVSGCKKNGILCAIVNGKLRPSAGFEMAFLEFLDRRRYNVALVPKQTEFYVAANRKGVQGQDGRQEGES